MFQRLSNLGKKLYGGLKSAMSLGQKVATRVSGIANKVQSVSKYIKPFIPAKYSAKVDKGLSIVGKAGTLSESLSKGINKAQDISGRAAMVVQNRDLGGAAKIMKEAYHDAKNLKNATRSQLERPAQKDKTAAHPVLTAGTSTNMRAAQRGLLDKGLKSGGGVRRHPDPILAKAMAAAQSAQKQVSKKAGRKGGLFK